MATPNGSGYPDRTLNGSFLPEKQKGRLWEATFS